MEEKAIPTGPAPNREDVESMAGLFSHPGWESFKRHLNGIRDAAELNLRKIGRGEEYNGYMKGIKYTAEDLIELPQNLSKQIQAIEKERKKAQS